MPASQGNLYLATQRGIDAKMVVEPTHLKNMLVRLDHFPTNRAKNEKDVKPPPKT